MTMSVLRQKLQAITDDGQPDGHPRRIRALKRSLAHSIEVLTSAVPINRYTCGMHALGLTEHPEYIAIVDASPSYIFASMVFVDRLVRRGVLKRIETPTSESLVVYRDKGAVRHIGRMVRSDRAESKWGMGHLYEHGLYEVPSSYGDDTQYFDAIGIDTALDELVEFAKEAGVRFYDSE